MISKTTKTAKSVRRFSALFLACSAVSTALVAQAQNWEPPAIAPLNTVTVPDVNVLGILDGSGPSFTLNVLGADAQGPITKEGQKEALQALGKALFWDMQVGGDGIQACASCHYHAGADNRKIHQVSPHGPHGGLNNDGLVELIGENTALIADDYEIGTAGVASNGIPSNEALLLNTLGYTADAIDGTPGILGQTDDSGNDFNDIVSSQGIAAGEYTGLSGGPTDSHTGGEGLRLVPPRNTPSAINAIYNLRNFWDGRAETYFNGVNPAGFRDQGAAVLTYSNGALVAETLRVPFSSLASQAVGPIGSTVEMIYAGRSNQDLGKKLLAAGVMPLAGQNVACDDSALSGYVGATCEVTTEGLVTTYGELIDQIFDDRFTGANAENVCVDIDGAEADCTIEVPKTDPATGEVVIDAITGETIMVTDANPAAYTLKEYNFALFFGLAVQAYEANLTTPDTLVDLIVGGVATGTVTNTKKKKTLTVDVGPTGPGQPGMPLEACIVGIQHSGRAEDVAIAEQLCTMHYAQFAHPGAITGAESAQATAPYALQLGILDVQPGTNIGGCDEANGGVIITDTTNANVDDACVTGNPLEIQASLTAINRGLGRFFAGATGCGVCHANPEFSIASVSALTGFGKAPLPPLPAGQLRRILPEQVMERMAGIVTPTVVYDTGFYNLGNRPTAEDWAQGEVLGGVPLAFSRLSQIASGGDVNQFADINGHSNAEDQAATQAAANELMTSLQIPTAPNDLTPRPFPFGVFCAPAQDGLRGRNTNNNCAPQVTADERIGMFGAFKTPNLRNVKFTGPYFHDGGQMNLRQVVDFYKGNGEFPIINGANIVAPPGPFALPPEDEAALVEMLETGLTDWNLAYQQNQFDHPQICVPHGQVDGVDTLVEIPAVGISGGDILQTFEQQLRDEHAGTANNLQNTAACAKFAQN